ncbi:hypothetical protein MJO28_007066 [Puccinia striiformis f. sp. tritici]|nr:hypothetical protein Pst134EA_013164 [Puccinia striiformis f. sp. tritici]KAH9454067.1 hypothetical protein Pst134EB_014164 [Puccinia striiformis f. sp. tritici]KAH9465274.1 hypothetical protein Pst134EA_013164 [Puccinia striiformis f. sp. tritici]KAI7951382.1 hypothetical protein MJO28_007066 [Puccinia striiformis f. sp. tritici]KAI9630628.1 hypothetical protein KEM48_013783 [Puccinia striiformis f. sp. tritici PST-130]
MSSGGMGRSQSEEEGSAAGEQGRLPTRSYSHQQRDPTPKGLSRTSSSSTSTHRRTNRSLSSSNRKSPIIFPHARSSTHSSPKTNHSSLSRNSSLHSSFSEAAYRSSNCNSPTTSPQPLPNHPTTTTPTTANTPTTSFHSAQQQQSGHKKSSRHPSFSYHGLEGKGSTGSHVQKPDYSEAKIVVAMVGLPARGKSYLSNKLQRYLKWLEFSVRVFNVGQHRRDKFRKMAQELGLKEDQSANFFDPNNEHARHVREELAAECLESLISWLKAGGNVGIHDATNTTKARRKAIVDRVKKEKGISLIFLESICTDPQVIEANVDVKVASGDPDYDGQPRENAKKDFLARIAHYEANYETVDEPHLSFCKVVNVGYEVTVNRIDNYLASRVAFYLMNLHITPRSIFFTRHGESQYNVEGKIGGDSQLSIHGMEYAKALPKLIGDAIGDRPLTVWTSTLKRTIQTARDLPYPKLTWKSLDELDAGVCDGMTYEEIEEHYPEDYAERDDDKFNYRYRGGESYRDVVVRLEPVIMELERQENILIVCHQAVLRCLYAYFHNYNQDELPYLKIPLHTVIKLTPKAYGCDEERFTLPIEAVDTTRPKPVKVGNTPPAPKIDDSPSPSTQRPLHK